MRVDDPLKRVAFRQAVLDQESAREAAPRLGCQAGQQAELGQRQLQRHGAPAAHVRDRDVVLLVDLDAADADGRGVRMRPRAPQHGPQARHDLGGIEGFDDVVVRAQAQPKQLVDVIGQRRDDDDGVWPSSRMARNTSSPSMPGRFTSSRTASGRSSRNSRMASTPSMAEQVRKPSRRR